MVEQTVTRETVIQKLTSLPPDGLAEVARFIEFLQYKARPASSATRSRSGEHPAFGIWADRPDLQDPVEFAQRLRSKIEAREDG
jgi:hypothetical protein